MDKRTKTMCLRVPESMAAEIEGMAALAECSVSQLMFLVMRQHLYGTSLPPRIQRSNVYKANLYAVGTQ
jgi:hypothetical protein